MDKKSMQEKHYPEIRFGGFTRIDGTVAFYARVNALAEQAIQILDVGCGRGAQSEDSVTFRRSLRNLRRNGRTVVGIDVDNGAESNPFIDEFRLMRGGSWPIDNASIDLCVADCVLEHISEVNSFFAEARRVLRSGGHLCIRTTNVWSYVALVSRVVPNRMHAKILQKVQDRREVCDVFPTVYRCNSIPKIRKALADHGFGGVVYGHEAEPAYLSFSQITYYLGVVHQKLSPEILAPTLFAFAVTI